MTEKDARDLALLSGFLGGYIAGWKAHGGKVADLTAERMWAEAPPVVKERTTESEFSGYAVMFLRQGK